MRIGLYGGTFDPPHKGHTELAKEIIENSELEKIIFIPSASPPHKPKNPITKFIHRYKMLQLAMEDYENFEISDIEQKFLPEKSYTLKTIQYFIKNYKDNTFYLIIGQDSLNQLHTWYKSGELVNLCNFISYPREGETTSMEGLKKVWPEDISLKLYKSILDLPVFPVSSTEIRKKIQKKEENLKELLNKKVLDYIYKHNLYNKSQ